MSALRLLVLDHDATDTPLVQSDLVRAGFNRQSRVVASRGEYEAALSAAPWDLVIVRDSVPGFEGAQALAALKRSGLDIPFIIVGGTAADEHAVGPLEAGVHDFVDNRDLARMASVVERVLREAAARRAGRPMAAVPTPVPARPATSAGQTILVVEDDASVRMVTRRALERVGYIVIEAGTPSEALGRLDPTKGPRIDLLLTDLVMPGMSGPELAERIIARMGDLPVLFMSGHTSADMLDRGIDVPEARFLSKPFSIEELLARVRKTIGAPAQGVKGAGAPPEPDEA